MSTALVPIYPPPAGTPRRKPTLDEYLRFHYLASRDLSPKTAAYLRVSVRRIEGWFGRPILIDELNDALLNAWIASMQQEGLNCRSVKGQRGNILALWRDAFFQGFIDTEPVRVKQVKITRQLPEAWTIQQVQKLLETARSMGGTFRSFNLWDDAPSFTRGEFFTAVILVGWDTALRLSDLLTVKRANLGADGTLPVVQNKTNDVVYCRLRPETLAACKVLWDRAPNDDRLLPFPCQPRQFMLYFKRLVKKAGIPSGGIKRIRKSAATALEQVTRGAATEFLGHRSPGMAQAHYIDPRLVKRDRPMPPSLVDGKDGAA